MNRIDIYLIILLVFVSCKSATGNQINWKDCAVNVPSNFEKIVFVNANHYLDSSSDTILKKRIIEKPNTNNMEEIKELGLLKVSELRLDGKDLYLYRSSNSMNNATMDIVFSVDSNFVTSFHNFSKGEIINFFSDCTGSMPLLTFLSEYKE